MDSLSQAVLGASLMAAVLPASQRRKALLAGAALGTLPDLDTFIVPWFTQTPVNLFTWHRGPSHALWVLTLLAWLLWWLWKPRSQAIRAAPWQWLLGIELVLLTHTLLDALTIYGTQLWWPSPGNPVMWGSLFIIDPLYTVPLLLGVLAAVAGGARHWAGVAVSLGLLLSTAYIGWSLGAKHWATQAICQSATAQGLGDMPLLVTPTPLNTLLWRAIVMTPDGYAIGYRSLLDGPAPVSFTHYPDDSHLLYGLANTSEDIARLRWFTSGFVSARVDGNRLLLQDLRMGTEGSYTFTFAVAEQPGSISPAQAADWQVLQPAVQVDIPMNAKEQWQQTWQRLQNPVR